MDVDVDVGENATVISAGSGREPPRVGNAAAEHVTEMPIHTVLLRARMRRHGYRQRKGVRWLAAGRGLSDYGQDRGRRRVKGGGLWMRDHDDDGAVHDISSSG
jgi:hypothetical protein